MFLKLILCDTTCASLSSNIVRMLKHGVNILVRETKSIVIQNYLAQVKEESFSQLLETRLNKLNLYIYIYFLFMNMYFEYTLDNIGP